MKTNSNQPFREIPELYEIAKKITLEAGMPYTDPRTRKTTQPPNPLQTAGLKASKIATKAEPLVNAFVEPRLGPTPEQDKELDKRREEAIDNIIKSLSPVKEKKKPPCARCGKPKKTAKHHWPLSSSRLVPLCDHCYAVTKKQRKRASKFF